MFYSAGLDFVVASAIYQLEGQQWQLTHHWLFDDVLHQGSRHLNSFVLCCLLVVWLYHKMLCKNNVTTTTALTKLLLSLLLSFASVALLKRLLPTECPWHLQQFGGHLPFISMFSARPVAMPSTQCFPAGHASIGYAWVALYFYFLPTSPTKARIGLTIALWLGFVLGMAQQLRGAHFVSHDLTTLWLCWTISTLVYLTYPSHTIPSSRDLHHG